MTMTFPVSNFDEWQVWCDTLAAGGIADADQPSIVRYLQEKATELDLYVEIMALPADAIADSWALVDRTFSAERRRELAKKGWARPDGSYPIENEADLRNAIRAFGRAAPGDRAAVKAHIIRQARRLGRTDLLPDDWK